MSSKQNHNEELLNKFRRDLEAINSDINAEGSLK